MKSAIFCLLVVSLAAIWGCVSSPKPPHADSQASPVVSSEAQTIYSYLAYRELVQENRLDEAAKLLENVIAEAPTTELYLDLGNIYWRASRFPEAVQVLNRAIETFPDSDTLIRTLAKIYASQGRLDDAISILDAYRKKHPEISELTYEAAIYLMEQRHFEEAARRLEAVSAGSPSVLAYFLLGKVYVGQGLLDKAVGAYRQAVALDSEYIDAWIELGMVYTAQKNYGAARQIFSRLLDSGIESPQIIFQLVDLALKQNQPDQALATAMQYSYNTALALESANLFLRQGFYDHAAQLLDPLAQASPVPPDALLYLAILEYEGRDNEDQALAYLEAIPDSHPHHERSLIFRIHLLYQKDERQEARILSQKAIARYPGQPDFQVVLAELYERDKEFSQAVDVLLKATTRWPDDTNILYRLGLIYDSMGYKDQALLTMEKVIARNSEHADALNYLGYCLAEMGRDMERALILIRSALKIEPNNGYFVDSLAWAYYQQGALAPAWQEIKRAVALVDTDATIWEHFGDIARALKHFAEARRGYVRALELEPKNAREIKGKLDTLRRAR